MTFENLIPEQGKSHVDYIDNEGYLRTYDARQKGGQDCRWWNHHNAVDIGKAREVYETKPFQLR